MLFSPLNGFNVGGVNVPDLTVNCDTEEVDLGLDRTKDYRCWAFRKAWCRAGSKTIVGE